MGQLWTKPKPEPKFGEPQHYYFRLHYFDRPKKKIKLKKKTQHENHNYISLKSTNNNHTSCNRIMLNTF